jgi:hypothetical protein
MNGKNWEECLKEGFVEVCFKDLNKASSLRKTAGRIRFFDSQKINSKNANYIFEGYYTSLIEIIHSVLLKEGFKVSNHICLGYYLRDILKRTDLFRIFDDLRFKRNSIVYYGDEMDFETCKEATKKCKFLIKEVRNIKNI